MAITLYCLAILTQQQFENRFNEVAVNNSAALWNKAISSQIDHMYSAYSSLTRDKEAIDALERQELNKLADYMQPTFNRLSAMKIISDLWIIDTQGVIKYSAVDRISEKPINMASILKSIKNEIIIQGIDNAGGDSWKLIVSLPIYSSEKNLLGVAVLVNDLKFSLNKFISHTYNNAYIYDLNGEFIQGTENKIDEVSNIIKKINNEENSVGKVEDKNGEIYRFVFSSIYDFNKNKILYLISTINDTESIIKEKRNKVTVSIAAFLVFIISILWLNWGIAKENTRVDLIQKNRIQELTFLNREKEIANLEIKKINNALIESEKKYHRLISEASDAILLLDVEGKIIEVNKAAEMLLGYSRDKLLSMHYSKIFLPEYKDKNEKTFRSLLDQGSYREQDIPLLKEDGTTVFVDSHITAIKLNEKIIIQAISRDITQRKKIEEKLIQEQKEQQQLIIKLQETQNQLLQSEKMASLGQLAAGVTHEINNPVGYVSSNLISLNKYLNDLVKVIHFYEKNTINNLDLNEELSKLKNEIDFDFIKEDVFVLLRECGEGISRVKQIVQDLKNFSHVDEIDWTLSDIHKGIDSTLNVVRNEIKYKAEVVKEYGNIPLIECIPGQINQVFMNILVNAAQAIEERGIITIKTKCIDKEKICIEISDTGQGIDSADLKKIFDPFFTTKPIGQGTGLGLSLSFSIIQNHNGSITVTSELGKGTIFSIILPILQNYDNS